MTTNKETFEKVRIYLHYPVLCHGWLYVAFSRARAKAAMKVKVLETNQQGIRGGNTVTLNIIIKNQDVL